MFDFTKEIGLDPKNQKIYRQWQTILYLTAFLVFSYLSYLIIFPHKYFFFSFLTPNSNDNNIIDPRWANDVLFFNTYITSEYSKADISLVLNNSSLKPESLSMSVRKSYQAFMLDLSDPIGFKDGSLLLDRERYYLVSDGKLRKFQDVKTWSRLGFSNSSFRQVSGEDLKYNPAGEDISENSTYPNNSLFHIDRDYFILENQKLRKFMSDQAFFSQYDQTQAIEKNSDFLDNYPLSDELKGYSDGTLLASSESVFVVSGDEIFPFDNPLTFENKGYYWKDVLAAGADELANYKKGKLMNIRNAHPNGTIFQSLEDSKYYLVRNGAKHSLPSQNIFESWFKYSPIPVSEKALKITAKCHLEKGFIRSNHYSCEIPLENLIGLIGNSHEFNLTSMENGKDIEQISIDYKKTVTWTNFKSFWREMLNLMITSYVQKTAR